MMPVNVNAPTMLNHTSTFSTVMNLKRDGLRTGFLITWNEKLLHNIKRIYID